MWTISLKLLKLYPKIKLTISELSHHCRDCVSSQCQMVLVSIKFKEIRAIFITT